MANLKTTYKDDILDTTQNTKRKFNMIQNTDGTVSFEDVTDYSQVGDTFGAADMNAITGTVNELNSNLTNTNTNVANLSNSVNSCFQSASSGKATVASAITAMGVSTASDATYATMATNIKKITTGQKVIYLGTGTSFDVRTVCNNNGIPYGSLNTNNFIVGVSGGSSIENSFGYYGAQSKAQALGFSVGKSYSNGILSISGAGQTVRSYNAVVGAEGAVTQPMTAFAYLIY